MTKTQMLAGERSALVIGNWTFTGHWALGIGHSIRVIEIFSAPLPMVHPLVYEINTRCWLQRLSEEHGAQITLANVPEGEFARWHHLGFTHLWLMGVWATGSRSRTFSRRLAHLGEASAKGPSNFSEDDFAGSPYAIAGYGVSEALGGEAGLKEFRIKLAASGFKLILDFIPNHTGLDHPWLKKRPDLFVQSRRKAPGTFRENTSDGPRWIAHGRDPYFAPWADTAQLDYRNPATRALMIEELKSVARRCDGVRCDMAMLLLNEVFARTWAGFPGPQRAHEFSSRRGAETDHVASTPLLGTEFWADAISAIKTAQPGFLFLAEAYWDLEARLLDLGFDFAYDKRLTDHVIARSGPEVQRHLFALAPKSLNASAHFLENHDEPRIASLLSLEEHRAAALLILGLPGMRLLHEGQLTGATIRVSVHLRRCPPEIRRPEISAFYELFLTTLHRTAVGQGDGQLLRPTPAWNGNPTAENLIVVQWQSAPSCFDLVVVNPAPHPSQCYVEITVDGLAERNWEMTNLLGPERFKRGGAALRQSGLYLDLPAHGAQLFHFRQPYGCLKR